MIQSFPRNPEMEKKESLIPFCLLLYSSYIHTCTCIICTDKNLFFLGIYLSPVTLSSYIQLLSLCNTRKGCESLFSILHTTHYKMKSFIQLERASSLML